MNTKFIYLICLSFVGFVPDKAYSVDNNIANEIHSTSERPNIILIMCDDLGYNDVGFNGGTEVKTPHIDALAAKGTICTSGYVCHPFCGPSRMGLMAGRYPHKFGSPFNLPNSGLGIEKYNRQGIDVNEKLISSVLRDAGYMTGAIGKWHMGIAPPFHPNRRGFEEFFGFLGGGHMYFPEKYNAIFERQTKNGKSNINDYVAPLQHNGATQKGTKYLTDELSDQACAFVKQASKKNNPFFLYLAYNAPHSPLEATDKDILHFQNIKDEKRRTYCAMVYAVDRGVGQLVQTLKKENKYENSLIVFLSDNGGKESLGADNGKLKGGKGMVHEGGYRVPMFFHWPQQSLAKRKYPFPVTSLDFYPTFARLANAKIPQSKKLDGIDIWDHFIAGKNARNGGMIYTVRHGNGFSDVGIRQNQWKASRIGYAPWKLFDLENDLAEEVDISGLHSSTLKNMVSKAEMWSRDHTLPQFFNTEKAEQNWIEKKMPNYTRTFSLGKPNNE